MITALQIILTTLACAGLWWFWSRTAGQGKASLIITAGFLLRAMGGQILFWISWLKLPIARSLQLGNGFWFFAVDGPGYLAYADELIGRGVAATVFATATYPSHVFVQIFTTCAALFGTVASVAILLNCAAFLGTCAIINSLGRRDSRTEPARLAALAAVAFGPGTILWSLQPLKDTFFLFLIAALIGVCYRWQELWREGERRSWRRLLGCAALMLVVVYGIAGMRWYFAATICAICIVFFTLTAVTVRPRWSALVSATVLVLLLSQAFRIGGDYDIPRWVRRLVDPRPIRTTPVSPISVGRYVQATRIGFDNVAGATTISPGPALAAPRAAGKSVAATKRVSAGEVLEVSKVITARKPLPITTPVPVTTVLAVTKPEPVTTAVPVTKSAPVTTAIPITSPVPVAMTVPVTRPVPVATTVPVNMPVLVTTDVPVNMPVPVATTVPVNMPVPVTTDVPVTKPVPVATTVPVNTPGPVTTAVPVNMLVRVGKRIVVQTGPDGDSALPSPPLATTLVTGISAMFLPRVLGQALGLIRIGGGRGFWLFVELDTLVFDAMLLFAVVYCRRALNSFARVTPLFIFVVLVLVMTAGPMLYIVSNFGTLFRLRQMVYFLIALLPLTLAPRLSSRAGGVPVGVERGEESPAATRANEQQIPCQASPLGGFAGSE